MTYQQSNDVYIKEEEDAESYHASSEVRCEKSCHESQVDSRYDSGVRNSFPFIVKEEALSDQESRNSCGEEEDQSLENTGRIGNEQDEMQNFDNYQRRNNHFSMREEFENENRNYDIKIENQLEETSFEEEQVQEMMERDFGAERERRYSDDDDDDFEEVDEFYEEEEVIGCVTDRGLNDDSKRTLDFSDSMENGSDDDYNDTGESPSTPKANEESMFACEKCPKTFKSLQGYKKHKLSHRKQRLYSCSYCPEIYRFKKDFMSHMCLHLNTICTVCGKKLNDVEALLRHVKVHSGEKPYECKTCKKRFLEKGNLDVHKRIHTKEKPYTCSHCGKTFSDPSNFNRHKKSHSGIEVSKAYQCKICNERFTRSTSLYRHYVRLHRGEEEILGDDLALGEEKNFPDDFKKQSCRFCGKKFGTRETLGKHELLHKECDILRCKYCRKLFSTKESLYQHGKVHNYNLDCKYCGASFNRRESLVGHERIHENTRPFACTECDAQFTLKRSLTRHKQIHSGVKPHGCNTCGKRFHRSSDLTVHKRTHSDEKPYSCEKCGHNFAAQTNFAKHARFCGQKKRKVTRKRKVAEE